MIDGSKILEQYRNLSARKAVRDARREAFEECAAMAEAVANEDWQVRAVVEAMTQLAQIMRSAKP